MKINRYRFTSTLGAVLFGLALAAVAALGGDIKPHSAPGLPTNDWLNTPQNKPLHLEELRGKVVLVEFWTFGCINCRNTLPSVERWHDKYASQGLVVIGVHTPELEQERRLENLKQAVRELGIRYPVAIDNDYAAWNRYKNRYWPAMYLIDPAGQIVYTTVGEGNYEITEARIRALLEKASQTARQ